MLDRLREEWRILSGHYVRESERAIGRALAESLHKGYPIAFEDGRFTVDLRPLTIYRLPRYSKATNHRIAMAAMEAFR